MKRTLLLVATTILATTVNAQVINEPGDIPIEKFAQLPLMSGAELSPDGTALAYIRPMNGRSHLIIQDLTGGSNPKVVPPGEDLDIVWLHWANTNRLVFLVSASRKRDTVETIETRLMAIDKDGANGAQIVLPSERGQMGTRIQRRSMQPQIQGDVIHWLPDEPNYILVAVDGDFDGADEVRKIDVRNGSFNNIRRGTDGIQRWLTDQTGQVRFGWGYWRRTFKMEYLTNDNKWRSADDASWSDAGFWPLGFAKEPNIAYMTGPSASGNAAIFKVDVSTDEILEPVFQEEGIDADGLAVDPLTQLPAGVRYTDDRPRVRYFDPEMRALQDSIREAMPEQSAAIHSMTADRQQVLLRSAAGNNPGTYLHFDRASGRITKLTDVMPGLPSELLSSAEPVSYDARDGLTIPAYITFPLGAARENLPFIVLPHGGPASRDDAGFSYLSQFLVSRGYGVLQPNFRGSTGYGKNFEQAGKSEWGGKMQTDVVDGTQWLIDQGFADPERICIVGGSYGGYAAAMGAVQTPKLYQCAASINGVLNLPRLIADDKKYIGGGVWTKHMGLAGEKAKAVSPYHQAEKIEIPMLIIQAEDDTRVHGDQGKGMARRLRRLKKPHQYVEVELGGHTMNNEAARVTTLSALETFLAENFQ